MGRPVLEGRRLLAVTASAIVAVAAACVLVAGTGPDGMGVAIRATARMSVGFFVVAFAASSLVALWPRPATKWLLRNRRYLGLSMAVSHGLHAAFIAGLAVELGAAFWETQNPLTLAGGGLGYAFLIAMTVTSTDAAVARLGRRRWHRLHLTGMYVLWGIFAFTYGGAVAHAPGYAIPTIALAAALAVRIAARRRAAIRRAAVERRSPTYAA